MLINIKLTSKVSAKTNKPWFMVQTIAGDYTGEPVFVSKLEYDYLTELTKDDSSSFTDEE